MRLVFVREMGRWEKEMRWDEGITCKRTPVQEGKAVGLVEKANIWYPDAVVFSQPYAPRLLGGMSAAPSLLLDTQGPVMKLLVIAGVERNWMDPSAWEIQPTPLF